MLSILVVATTNKNKLKEFKEILKNLSENRAHYFIQMH